MKKSFFITLILQIAILPTIAAPYAGSGVEINYRQPGGSSIRLYVKGSQYYARTVTKDGYTVIHNPEDQTYYYARLNAQGDGFIPTNLKVGRDQPVGLAKHIRLNPSQRKKRWEKKNTRLNAHKIQRWKNRVRAAQQRRNPQPEVAGEGSTGGASAQFAPAFAPVNGNKKGLTILVQFPDDPDTAAADPTDFPSTQAKMERYCNELGYNDDGNTGSVRDYFRDQSLNAVDYSMLVTAIVTVPQPRNYYNYSDYPANTTLRDSGQAGRTLLTDAIQVLKNQNFNFDALTLEGSNVLSTNLFFAGNTSGVWSEGLWPHRWVMSPKPSVTINGITRYIFDYQITNITNNSPKIGTFIHESGHLLLDYPDLYDYGGESNGIGTHGLMASGNFANGGRTPAPINLYFKDIVGWANITEISAAQYVNTTLPTTGNVGYRIRKPGVSNEYFVVENRGSGDKWGTYVPDKGIMIWHIDENVNGNNNRDRVIMTIKKRVLKRVISNKISIGQI